MRELSTLERKAFFLLIGYLKKDNQERPTFKDLAEISEAISDFKLSEDASPKEQRKHRSLFVVQRLINLVVLGQSVDGTLFQTLHRCIKDA